MVPPPPKKETMFRAKTVVFTVFQAHFVYYIYIPYHGLFGFATCLIFTFESPKENIPPPLRPSPGKDGTRTKNTMFKSCEPQKNSPDSGEQNCCDFASDDHWKKVNPNKSSPIMVGLDGGFPWFKLGQRDGKFQFSFSWTTFWEEVLPT